MANDKGKKKKNRAKCIKEEEKVVVILDTSIIIDHLRAPKSKKSFLMKLVKQKPKEILAVSSITIQELYEGKSTKEEEKEQYLLATISPLRIIPYTYEVAKLAGEIARDLDRPIEFTDAAIAATAINHGAQLFTLDKKDFADIKNLDTISSHV